MKNNLFILFYIKFQNKFKINYILLILKNENYIDPECYLIERKVIFYRNL